MSSSKVVLVLVFLAVAFLSYRYFSQLGLNPAEAYGVKVVSDKPVGDYVNLINSRGVTLLKTSTKGGLTCGFQFSATLSSMQGGYPVNMEEGEQGIYLYDKEAFIKGMTEDEMVTACNAFSCIANNITCPDNVAVLAKMFSSVEEMNIVVENYTNPAGVRAYSELLGVLSFMQAEKLDVNMDGAISEFELNNVSGNFLAIRPYVMSGGTCYPVPLLNLYQNFNPEENLTVSCSSLYNTIFIVNSTENKIAVDGSNVILYGDDDHLYKESVILRDAMSPKWIRVFYQVEGKEI